jgi:type IV secretion system protein VirD4
MRFSRRWIVLAIIGLVILLFHTALYELGVLFVAFWASEWTRVLHHTAVHLGSDWAAWWHPGLTARYEAYQQDHALQQIGSALALLVLLVITALAIQTMLQRRPRMATTRSQGSARFAMPLEIARFHRGIDPPYLAPLALAVLTHAPWSSPRLATWRLMLSERCERLPRPRSYLVLGRAHGREVALSEAQQERHVLIVGSTGQGKSTSLIIPGLLSERGHRSVFCIDPKGELISRTSGALARNHVVWVFAPDDPQHSLHYNPLLHITTLDEAQDFALAWIENTGQSSEPYWNRMAETLLVALILHLRVAEPHAPFYRLVQLVALSLDDMQKVLLASPSPVAKDVGQQFMANLMLNKRTASGLLTDVVSRFARFQSPALQQVTSTNDLEFAEMVDRPTALYLSIPASSAEKLRPLSACLLLQMFATWAKRANTTTTKQLPRGIVCYLDEFAHAGKIPHMANLVAMLRSQRVALILAIQNHSQLDAVYGRQDADTLLANATTHLLLPGGGQNEVEYYSRRAGTTTVISPSLATGGMAGRGTSVQWGQQERLRPLITPDELRTLPTGQAMVLMDQLAPFLVQLQPYYRSRDLRELAAIPPVIPAIGSVFAGDLLLPILPLHGTIDDDEDEEAANNAGSQAAGNWQPGYPPQTG